MLDENVLFEHKLRAHVNEGLARCEQFDTSMNEHNVTWEVRYRANDGGSWRVTAPFRYRVEGTFTAAMLSDALQAAFDAVRFARAVKVLPSLISHAKE